MSVLTNSPLTPITDRSQLIGHFQSGEKEKAKWRIGCEHEKFVYRLSDLSPVHYDGPHGIRRLLLAMRKFGWQELFENNNIIGLTKGQATISLEPGGQVELSGAPLQHLHEVAAEIHQHLLEVCDIGSTIDMGFLGIGFHPTATREDLSWVPKERYRIMRDYMSKRGTMGIDMMLRTASVQVNLDFLDETDMINKYRTSLALQPIATALFAASPFTESHRNGYNSFRMNVWAHTDDERCAFPSFVFEDGFGYERYTDYALDVPMYFVYRDKRYIDCSGQSFRDFLRGKLPSLPGVLPTLNDWDNHLTTLFPSVRLKKYLELRGADSGSYEMLVALPSFWVGLLYDEISLHEASQFVQSWTTDDILQLNSDVNQLGLNSKIRGISVSEIAQRMVSCSRDGLRRRSATQQNAVVDESSYLDVLSNFTTTKINRADQIMAQQPISSFNTQKLYDTCQLKPRQSSSETAIGETA